MHETKIRFLLVGAGNVGRRLLELIHQKQDTLRSKLALELVPVGVADSSGAAICPDGLDPAQIARLKAAGRGVADLARWGRAGTSALEMVQATEADLLLEASPVNMQNGQPGLGCIENALSRGMDVVTANKAPLVLAFPRLLSLAQSHGARLRFDATVAGGLPVVNLGQRDLAVAEIHRMEGILNLTANYILTRMAQDGLSFHEALSQAQAAGHAETDPALDIEGWDAANKLVILAHSVLDYPATLEQVSVQGITHITAEDLRQAAAEGKCIKLMATAERDGSGYRLDVRPARLGAAHPLAHLGAVQMGIVFYTDVCGTVSAAIVEETPIPTASAMLRDIAGLYADNQKG